VLGLFGDQDKPNFICPPFDPDAASGAEPSPRLRQFVDSFGERGVAGSVCADSYKAVLRRGGRRSSTRPATTSSRRRSERHSAVGTGVRPGRTGSA
jgi:hypothetical protein